jgi:hypothetical protein
MYRLREVITRDGVQISRPEADAEHEDVPLLPTSVFFGGQQAKAQGVGGGMSTRAAHRNIAPCPLHVRVTVPDWVMLIFWPMFKLPLNPGAVTRQDGVGFPFGASDVALRQVMLAGAVIFALAECWPSLSDVACSDCTLPRRARCAPAGQTSNKIAITSSDKSEGNPRIFIAHLDRLCTLHPQPTGLQYPAKEACQHEFRDHRKTCSVEVGAPTKIRFSRLFSQIQNTLNERSIRRI